MSVRGATRLPWYRLLAGSHPQRVEVRIEPRPEAGREDPGGTEGAGLRLSLDLTFVGWYRRLVLALWALWVTGLSALFAWTDPGRLHGAAEARILLPAVLAVLAVAGWTPFLLRSLGGARLQATLWQPILRAVDRAGGHLEPEGTGAGRRFGLWFLAYGASFLAFGGGALALHAVETAWQGGGGWFLLVLGGLAALLLASALAIGVWRGFGLRVEALVVGLGTSVSVLFLLMTPLLLVLTVLAAGTDGATPAGDPDHRAWWSRAVLGGTVLIPLLGLGLGAYTVATSRHVRESLERTRRWRGRPGVYWEAVRGGALLAAARGFFGLYALAAGGVVGLTLALAALWGGQALGGVGLDGLLPRVPSLTGPVLAAAVGLPPDHPGPARLARAGWVSWGILVWALAGFSVGQLVRARSRLRRRLETCRVPNPDGPSSLRGAGTQVQRVAAGPEVYLAVTPGAGVKAIAHRFAWPRRRWIVEVSTGAVEGLAPDELEALVAHELAHLRHGHVLIRDLVLWVGRAAFVGDGFCRALLNSFGWEAEADREAARMLRERRRALVRCLWRVRDLNSLETDGSWPPGARDRGRTEGSNGAGGPAGGGTGGETGGDASPGGGAYRPVRWRDVWEGFLQHYLGSSALDYWHPVTDERVARLQAFDAGSGPGAAS
ncbi:MAG: M48 family metalloprotease [Thermoanaerobaculia bacterium]